MIELHFPVLGSTLPADHGYALYSAISRLIPSVHEDHVVGIGPIAGQYVGNGRLHLDPWRSRLRLRLAPEKIAAVLPLAGKSLVMGDHSVRLGVPFVRALVPAPNLVARLVTIKGFTEPADFLSAVCRQLQTLDINGEPGIPLIRNGTHEGQPRRHVLRIKEKMVVGFSLQVTGLTAEESIKLQEKGLGGRRKMGCGFFVGMREIQNDNGPESALGKEQTR
jgi:CRISPR-associated endonuclease/helicase Cas3